MTVADTPIPACDYEAATHLIRSLNRSLKDLPRKGPKRADDSMIRKGTITPLPKAAAARKKA